jgi:glyoxylase-like metal-dependent hydrolase (beta-lactamase superfamily II)
MRIATAETWYETRSLDDGVTLISEPHIKPFYRCNVWHLRGRDRDLLVDSGMGVVSLREQVTLVSERPLIAVASHSHFDHIGSHHESKRRSWPSPAASKPWRTPM